MYYRFALREDAFELARLHQIASSIQPSGFMFKLGHKFLITYYKILIESGSSVILCACNDLGELIGFVSGSINASSRVNALKKHRFRLFFACIGSFISNPSLLIEVYLRQNSKSANEGGYVINDDGAHIDFWAWSESKRGGAIPLLLKWLSIFRVIGINNITGEVDEANALILKTHEILGAKKIKEFITPDGRKRVIIRYDLTTRV